MEPHHETLLANPRTWVGIAFVIFFLIFGRKLWAALMALLDGHAERIRAELDEAARLRQQAETMLNDATARRDAAVTEAKALLANAHTEATRVGEAARTEAEAAGKRRERMAMDRIAAAEKAAVTEVRLAAADIAAQAARQVIATGLSADAAAQIVDRSIASLPAALASRRAA